jgi:acetoin utilization protein AcuB
MGIVTTNDFFYNVVNPVLGMGEPGTRIMVSPAGDSKSVEKIITCISQLDMEITVLWKYRELLVIHIDTNDATDVIRELQALGFSASIRPR